MLLTIRNVGLSLVISVCVILLIFGLSRIPGLESTDLLLAPGMLVSVLIFPEGIHSDHPNTFLLLAGFADALLLTWPVNWLKGRICRSKSQ